MASPPSLSAVAEPSPPGRVPRRPPGRASWLPKLASQAVLWRRPRLYYLRESLRGSRGLFDPACDLVLEAFPRSGNTYALRMLQFSQRKELVIRTHRHVPPVVLSALRIGKPVLLLVRPPREAVPSWQLYTGLPLEYVLRQYLLYHRILLPHRERMQVETFGDVTRDFRGVVERLERRFHFGLRTDFDEERCRADAMEHIDSHRRGVDGAIDVLRVNRPDPARAAMKERLLRAARSPRMDALFAEADALYAALVAR